MEKSIDQKKDKEKTSNESKTDSSLALSETLKEFLQTIDKNPQADEKLKKLLEFMKHALSQKGSPRFRDFWEAKKICLPLFKEKMSHAVREKLWAQYIELSTEAKNLKSILDEQSSFSVQQIELALKAIASDLENHRTLSAGNKSSLISTDAPALASNMDFYETTQKQIAFYITLSARTKELRKEILQTEMRIKDKNKLLTQLSKLADSFLPKKKGLIKEISDEFVADVTRFASKYFDLDQKQLLAVKIPLFKLRDEIKQMQLFAKSLSLNSGSFSKSRLTLSNCWEILREEGKVLKEKHAQRQKDFEEKVSKFQDLLSKAEQAYVENPPKSKSEVLKKVDEFLKALKEEKLHKNEVMLLKKELAQFEEKHTLPFVELEKKEKELQNKAQMDKELKATAFKEKYLEIVAASESLTLLNLKEHYENFQAEKKSHRFDFSSKLRVSELSRELFELILLKEEQDLTLEEDTEETKELFTRWEAFKEETRKRLESYRKEMGGSGFDFEKAMLYREYMDLEKARLDRAVEKVEFLEDYT